MIRQLLRHSLQMALVAAMTVGTLAAPVVAQENSSGGLRLATPYAGVAVEPGGTASFPLVFAAADGTRVGISVEEVPEGWPVRIRGGGFEVDEVILDEAKMPTVTIEVDVPDDAAEGSYSVKAVADSAAGRATLDLDIRVAAVAGGGVTLDSDFPVLRGPTDATFTFSLNLENQTPEDIEFALAAQAPQGWTVNVKPAGESQAATMTVAGGGSGSVNVEADPPADATAGAYPLTVAATGNGVTASIDLAVEITGSYSAVLSTPDQRLNADVRAGGTTDVSLVLVNTGSAPLQDVQLSATAPSGWEVTFDPATLAAVAPGETAPLTAVITPSREAVAGDYIVTFHSSVPEVRASVDLRTTVRTSEFWGVVGVGIIVIALSGLGLVFRRFGRR